MTARSHVLGAVMAAAVLLTGCGTVARDIRGEIEDGQRKSQYALSKPIKPQAFSRVSEVSGKFIPVSPVTNVKAGAWLKRMQIELRIDSPTPLSAVMDKFAADGINVVTDLPLSGYTYTGRIARTDADTALRAVLTSVGLDYQADNAAKLVVIKPMSSRSWFLDLGNRKSSYSSDGTTQGTPQTAQSANSATGTSVAGTSSNTSASSGIAGASDAAQNTQTSASMQSGNTGVAAGDDFWNSLATELKNRLTVLVLRTGSAAAQGRGMPAIPPGNLLVPPGSLPMGMNAPPLPLPTAGASMDQGGSPYVSRQIGSFSLNPDTGAITVQGPHWILDDLDVYIKRIQEMYNTDITFSGEQVLVTNTRSNSEGFDLAAFASWASGRYAAVVANNVLGGVTVSLPSSGPASVAAGSQPVAGPLLGLSYQGPRDALQIFNAFLAQIGDVSVIQRPLITTTSGVPGVFSKKFTDYYNTITQQAASGGTGSAATATQNILVPVELGTELRINPRIDVTTGLIRAQLTLKQAIQSGTKTVPQTITFGNSASTVNSQIPLVTRQDLQGEVLLRDGDLIVVGGQTEDSLAADENGLPGKDGPLSGIFGSKLSKRAAQTYYFALRVTVSKRK